jgi:hypothetical protein
MKVCIKTGFDKVRCCKCNKSIKTGQQYTIERTTPIARQDLKMNWKYRGQHYPRCESPGMWEEGLVKDRIGYKA